MSRGRITTIGILIAVLIAAIVVSPRVVHAGYFAWKKHVARKYFTDMPPQERRGFDLTPTMIVLPEFNSAATSTDIESIGGYNISIPHPVARSDEGKMIRLTYQGYKVIVRAPFSVTEYDSLAKQSGFKDSFEQTAATYHLRTSDLETQHDLPSLQQFLLNLALKPVRALVMEEFVRPDLRGFILGGIGSGKMIPVDVDLPQDRAETGVWFIDTGGLTLTKIHEFLSVLRYEHSR